MEGHSLSLEAVGQGLDPIPDDLTDFDDPSWKASPSLWSGGVGGMGGGSGDMGGRAEGEGTGINM